VCHHPAQVSEATWSPVFDLDPKMASETRDKLMARAEAEGSAVIAGHFAHPGFGRVKKIDGKRRWVAGL
jgi:hypothetical protein